MQATQWQPKLVMLSHMKQSSQSMSMQSRYQSGYYSKDAINDVHAPPESSSKHHRLT